MAAARKIIQLGEDTLVVSLPSAWARQHKLKKGDELEAEEQGPKLVFYPKSEAKPGAVSVDVSGTEPVTKRILGALYKAGYDEFEVKFETMEELSAIKAVMDEFIGFEIIEEGKNHVVIRNVSHIIPDEFENIRRKMIFVVATMADDSLAAIISGDLKKLQFIAEMDEDVNKYNDFCRRVLNTLGHKVVKRTAPSYYIVEQLERIGDSYRDICKYCSGSKVKISADTAAAYKDVNDFLKQFQRAFGKFDLKTVAGFAKTHYELVNELNKLLQKADKKELPVIVLLRIAELDIFDMNGALMAEKL